MAEIFIKSENIRTTRSTDETKLLIPRRRNEYGKNCLSYLGATIWNSINITIRKVKTCNTFKHKIKDKYFSDIKQKECDLYNY